MLPQVSARLTGNDACILALPHERSAHMAGGVYSFRRGVAGDIRLKLGPALSGGIRTIASHPSLNLWAGATARGAVYLLQQPLFTHWPGPMFPAGYEVRVKERRANNHALADGRGLDGYVVTGRVIGLHVHACARHSTSPLVCGH